MDAVMVVHQLQRLAATEDPSPAVAAKLPRVAVGICYFIDHPEVGVRQQAANAVKKVVSLHGGLLQGTKEGIELEKMLSRHAETSKDAVVAEACRDALQLFQKQASGGETRKESKLSTNAEAPAKMAKASCDAEASSSPAALPPSEEASSRPKGGEASSPSSPGGEDLERASRPCTPADPAVLPEGEMYTVLLGLRGLAAELRRKRENGAPPSPSAALSPALRATLDDLQRELQYRLVCIPGVSSATITLNIRGLCTQLEAEAMPQSSARGSEEGDGVAVLLVRLSQEPTKRMRHLQDIRDAAGPLTLVLRAERVYDGGRAGKSRSKTAGEKEAPRGGQEAAPAYLDEETSRGRSSDAKQQNDDAERTQESCGEGLHGTGETAAGYSFFSRNSVLFTQSRFLGSSILPYEDDPELATRLKREKEKKAAERLKQLESQTVLDRVLGNIGKVRFW
ncbi:hypothetical protein TGPRC2_265180 [Toxoplasma gondii TgCatPRC2]|uniref:Uncharacterized protein n=12 Tax=Toxoplasma gondii TaxID=5811 RepID=S7UI07_TOXGG|nr:hypothetical protein TGME49_265180 [Toxoplasma gondii ME49]EPR57355.1 hypothetical protein TGGT1_265180 [Toxoplasma gondii GT1]KAF4644236.1 hypothetical protein TGRH88_012280 [Toxoplasma gondii]KFG38517.1 hypothetical protein TGDOM2_265180 [Toxoplasma gondii GAB2-2007-GAL-DOM2]KFG42216.1 hypothetical protein TGFOU_265180 [Toxoplasma gondii FOU]KFG58285.1 hypothetical protein TGRUB_265180 [Toxoplasma gondii RUB]KFH08959.1 hypothetical protein TGMAS_265180 [Toxoplasma gondii MAS]KYF45391.1 |eukprot:XP_002368647.1 hypothetical protein TGME49_265180 [Toxoplasma gondii ME49]